MSRFDLRREAPWRAPLRRALLGWWQTAHRQPERGLVCANLGDGFHLHAWDVAVGALRQKTRGALPVVQGAISADGQVVYALLPDEQRGAEGLGRYGRLPWEGGLAPAQDLAPQLAPYVSFFINECSSGRILGFMALNDDGFQMFALDALAGGMPHLRYEGGDLALGPFLSYDGEISLAALSLGEGAERGFMLESYDTRTGESLHVLAGEGLMPVGFAPRPHDMRFLAHDAQGVCWWNARTGELRHLAIGLEGALTPLDWSSDAARLLLRQDQPEGAALWLYRLADDQLSRLSDAPQGYYERAIFTPQGTILAEHQDASRPPRLLELGPTGAMQRLALALDDEPPAQSIPAPLARLLLSEALLGRPGRYHGFGLALRAAGLALGRLDAPAPADSLPSFGLALGDEALEAAERASTLGLRGLILVDPSARLLRLSAEALACPVPVLILQAEDDPQRPPLPLGGLLARWPSALLQHYAAHDPRRPAQEAILAALLRFVDQAL